MAIAIDSEREFDVLMSSNSDAEDERLALLHACRRLQFHDAEIIEAVFAHESVVEWDTACFKFCCCLEERFGGITVGKEKDARGGLGVGKSESVLEGKIGAGELAATGVDRALAFALFKDLGGITDEVEFVSTGLFAIVEDSFPLGKIAIEEVFSGFGSIKKNP